jgi:hypothetical protein
MLKWTFWITLPILLQAADSQAKFCRSWSEPKNEGSLERKSVPEASGMATSRRYPNRVYWVNDSGNKSLLFHSTVSGQNLKTIKIDGVKFRDTEALTVAPCGDDSCVIVGDVGNNNVKKRHLHLYVFKEKDLNGAEAKPFKTVEFDYPDEPHDAEALATLPDGRLILITKEMTLMNLADPGIYAFEKSQWLEGGKQEPKRIGSLPIRQWLPDKGFLGTAVTDAAVNEERNVLGILTYAALIETPLEKLKAFNEAGVWQADRDFKVLPIKALKQQETMTYDPKSARVIWSSEFFPPASPIYSMTCERIDY